MFGRLPRTPKTSSDGLAAHVASDLSLLLGTLSKLQRFWKTAQKDCDSTLPLHSCSQKGCSDVVVYLI